MKDTSTTVNSREMDSVVKTESRNAAPEHEKKFPNTIIAKVTVEMRHQVMLWRQRAIPQQEDEAKQ
jgi:hypothetical protein